MVFGEHYLHLPLGYTGVDLFFVLSGFLITGILFDSMDRPDRYRTFYIRRSLRIFPLYYGVLLALFALTPLLHLHWNKYWLVWPAYLGNLIRFLHPYRLDLGYVNPANGYIFFGSKPRVLLIGHFWSLSLEEQFYLMWPWVVYTMRSRQQLVRLCAVVVLTLPIIRVVTMALLPIRYTELQLTYSFTPFRVDALLIGALLALLIRGGHRQAVLQAGRTLCTISLPLVTLALFGAYLEGKLLVISPWRFTWGQSLVDLVAVSLVAAALSPGNLIYRLGNLPHLRKLGQISYGAYVFHAIPMTLYKSFIGKLFGRYTVVANHFEFAVALFALACTITLASLSYRYFELRF